MIGTQTNIFKNYNNKYFWYKFLRLNISELWQVIASIIYDQRKIFNVNKNLEKDDFKALNEFSDNLGIGYEVLVLYLSTNQVVVKLNKN